MEKSQLPLLRKKKGPKELVIKEKESSKKEKQSQGKVAPDKDSGADGHKDLRDCSPNSPKSLKIATKKDFSPGVSIRCVDAGSKDSARKSKTPVDLEWSKYVVKGGHQSDNYQKFVPEKSVASRQIQQCTSHKSHLPHQQYCATKFSSVDGYSPSAVQQGSKLFGSPGHSTAPSVFTFDHKQLYDPDSSPIYHELDPIDNHKTSANHTYQSITEIREEVERLQADAAGNILPVHSHSGSTKSPVRSNSGSVLSTIQNGSSRQHLSRTLPSPLPRSVAPKSPTHVSPAHSPTVAPQNSRSQSIFSRLWMQKKSANASKDSGNVAAAAATRGTAASGNAPTSPTTRNLSLEAICVDVPKVSKKANQNYSSVYAVTSPPPITASVFTDYYQNFHHGLESNGGPQRSQDQFDYYGLPSGRSLRNLCGPSKRSFSESTSCQLSTPKSKSKSQPGIAVENQLPWRTNRDLSPGSSRAFIDRWDIVRFGEPLDSHISGGGAVSLETFKGSNSTTSSKQNKTSAPSTPTRQTTGKIPPGGGSSTAASPSKKESSPSKKKLLQKVIGRSTRPVEEPKDTDKPAKTTSKSYLRRTPLSRSQENVLSTFSFDLICTSPPGSFESLLSEDDVFLPGSSERLNMLSPPSRSTFSSPSCGIRMAELRAGRRKSDSKSPSPEPPASTPPPFPPFFQIPAPCHIETVVKQDVAVQTSPTKSPVRLGGLSPHRYMHTIIEEDHSDQGFHTDGKSTTEHSNKREPKDRTLPDSHLRCDDRIKGAARSQLDQTAHTGTERHQTDPNLLGAISGTEDDDNSPGIRIPSEIRPFHRSSTSGNSRTGEANTVRSSSSCLKKTPSVTDIDQLSQIVSVDDPSRGGIRQSNGGRSFSVGSETDSATPSPVSLHESEAPGKRPTPKTSKLRPPKPAKFLAGVRLTADGQQNGSPVIASNQSDLPRHSSVLVRPRVGELRSVVPPLKHFSEMLPNMTVAGPRNPALIRHTATKPIESVGTGDHVVADAEADGEAKHHSMREEAPQTPSVPLKSGRNGTQQHKSPVGGGGVRAGHADQRRNISHLKSPGFDPLSASGSQDRIDTVGGCGSDRPSPPQQQQQISTDGSESSVPNCTKSAGGFGPLVQSKCDFVAGTRHSSLSSSLTSSSSSVYSVADSESEGVTAVMKPPRKDNFLCIARTGGTPRPPDGCPPCKGVTNESRGHDRSSRLAIPKINVSRCKDSNKTIAVGTLLQSEVVQACKQDQMLTNDNGCDVFESKESSSSSTSSSTTSSV